MAKDKTIYPKLPKVFKKKWIAALRSGEYKQGKGTLKQIESYIDKSIEYSYCCLGVACEISGATRIIDVPVIVRGRGIRGMNKVPSMLYGDHYDNLLIDKLVIMNDGRWPEKRKRSFKQIANWIEKNL